MKRRDFFTRMALGTAAVVVAPHLLAQEPIKALDPYRNVVNNPYYKWVKAKRSSVHTGDNNYWKCLSGVKMETPRGYPYEKWPEFYGEDLCNISQTKRYANVYNRIHAVSFREYDWVYESPWHSEGYHPYWMNIEDYGFYESLNTQNVFNPQRNHLLGVGLVPGLVDSLNPRGAYYRSPTYEYNHGAQTVRKTYPVDSYEIHVMYQKIK